MPESSLTLSDYCIINPPKWLPETISASDLVSFIPMQEVSETGEWTARQAKKLSEVNSGFTNFKNKDVLIAKITPCFENGKGALVDNLTGNVGFGSTEFHVLRAKDKTEPRFLFHLSQWDEFRVAALQFMSGSAGQQRVASEFFYKYRVERFTEDEQKIISNILDDVDTQIHKTETIIVKLQQVKQGLLHDLLTRGVDENGELRPSYDDAPELYKSSELGWIPKDWECLQLEELSEQLVDCPHSTPKFSNEGHLVARTMHIKNGAFLEKEASRVSEGEYQVRISRLVPKAGDIIFTREAPVGEAFVIPKGMKICLGQRVMIIRTKGSTLDSHFLLHQVYSELMSKRFNLLTAGTTTPHLNVSDVRELLILTPSFKEQQLHKDYLETYSSRERNEIATLHKLKLKKSALMDDLLTGKKRVTNLLNQQQIN